ncbi:MAG: FMN-binding protein [Candidatus Yonathbacteria bacterium]|nr:FMN-binding protein [Candidatus Yonathbacteria bacterium]
MSPFQKNLQRFLVFSFTATSVVLVIIGATRSKSETLSVTPAPGQEPTTAKKPIISVTPTTTQGTMVASTFTGRTYQTPWGNVVASISVINGKITDVTMPQVPNSPPSQYAEPYLVQQALKNGSANIQGVSGATYTSIAFKSSLEDAIVKASARGQSIISSTDAVTNSSATRFPASKPSVPRKYRGDDDEWDD